MIQRLTSTSGPIDDFVVRHLRPAILLVMCCVQAAAAQTADPNHFPEYPELGRYANFSVQVCGAKKVDVSPSTIPKLGCFALKAGTSLSGDVEGRHVSIRVASDATETFFVDGLEIQKTGSGTTNDPRVRPSASGYGFCQIANSSDCPVYIQTMDRQRGKFVLFDVSREFRPNAYVTNEENWTAEGGK